MCFPQRKVRLVRRIGLFAVLEIFDDLVRKTKTGAHIRWFPRLENVVTLQSDLLLMCDVIWWWTSKASADFYQYYDLDIS